MGLKKGEKVKQLGLIRILSTRWEPLNAITREDVVHFVLFFPHQCWSYHFSTMECSSVYVCRSEGMIGVGDG